VRLTLRRLSIGICAFACGGCASSSGPAVLTIPPEKYQAAFNAAGEAARREGMPPAWRDVRRGVIETESRIAGSIIEPWRGDNATAAQAWENTISSQRRRVRFEFVPRAAPDEGEGAPTAAHAPPDPTGIREVPLDLTQHEGAIDVYAWVIVERSYRPGTRRGLWSRRLTTRFDSPLDDHRGAFWAPVARDEAYERRLLAQVEAILGGAD
jgi:hypothetical protein